MSGLWPRPEERIGRPPAGRGIYIDPTSAATIAGLEQVLRDVAPDACVVSVYTVHGLKAGEKHK